MAKIKDTFGDYDELCVNLDNEQDIFIPLSLVTHRASFAKFLAHECEYTPCTDGTAVYWKGGPKLTIEEIMGIVEGSGL